jgi:predicted esterase
VLGFAQGAAVAVETLLKRFTPEAETAIGSEARL